MTLKENIKKLLPSFVLKVEKWDETRWTFLGKQERYFDLFLLYLGAIEFTVFLCVDLAGEWSIGLAGGLLGAYFFERIAFGFFKGFFHKHHKDLAEALAVGFLGPHYYYYHSYPYCSSKRVLIRSKLEQFGLVFNVTKIGLLLYCHLYKSGDYSNALLAVTTMSILEAFFTLKDQFYLWLNSPLPAHAYDLVREAQANIVELGTRLKGDSSMAAGKTPGLAEPEIVKTAGKPDLPAEASIPVILTAGGEQMSPLDPSHGQPVEQPTPSSVYMTATAPSPQPDLESTPVAGAAVDPMPMTDRAADTTDTAESAAATDAVASVSTPLPVVPDEPAVGPDGGLVV
ncbi:hypothetical protein HDU91_000772 [Kappamyces sp. JEL0680]|nr:hypothetical protein HDU91_000772 [Kappamyces sp. JEL0680]